MNPLIPQFYDQKVVNKLVKMSEDLMPIEQASTWKGRVVNVGETLKRTINQIIDLFKTGNWSVESQAMTKLVKDLHKVTEIADEFSRSLATRSPSLIPVDLNMRDDLGFRLNLMNEILLVAVNHSKNPEEFEELRNEFKTAIEKNQRIIKEERELKPQISTIGKAAKQAAAKGREKLPELRAAELNRTERPGKVGKISEQRKKTLDVALTRKHGEEFKELTGKKRVEEKGKSARKTREKKPRSI